MSFAAIIIFRRALQTLVLLAAVGLHPAWAATFVVNSMLDATDLQPGDGVCETASGNGVCTLRAAIQESNALPGADTVAIPTGTYAIAIPPAGSTDATGSFDISGDLSIAGAGAGNTFIDGGALDNVFVVTTAAKIISLSDLTVQNGSVPASRFGGGIFAVGAGELTLTDVVVQDNHAGEGGGIYSRRNLTLVRSTVRRNSAVRTTVDATEPKRGGGIYQRSGVLTLQQSSVSENTANSGGGIFNMGTAVIEASTISTNLATNVTLLGATGGGGIANGADSFGTLTITNSTISGNRANGHYGGLYNFFGTVTLNSVTITQNVADAENAGLGNGGGIGLGNAGALAMRDTLIAGNLAVGSAPDCFALNAAALTSMGYNLIGNSGFATDCAFAPSVGDVVGTAAAPIDPDLQPLANYGGPTLTQALNQTSPAVDAGDPNGCSDGSAVLSVDQRGVSRAFDGGSGTARCDIGAYELVRPIANAGPDQRVNGGVMVELNGGGSWAPGSIASFAWIQLAGTAVSLAGADTVSPSFTAPLSAGALQFQLNITDNFGTTVSDTVDVVVNAAPNADAGADQTVSTGATVSLGGSASLDSDGSIVSYSWVQTSGSAVALSNADTATPDFTAPTTADTLAFQLTVTDNDGATSTDSVTVTVSEPVPVPSTNIPPVAKAGADKRAHQHAMVVLNGWRSYDPDGRVVAYRWEQTGGPHVKLWGAWWPWALFVAPRDDVTLTFRLTVTDDKGATSTDNVTISVDGCVKRWYHFFFKSHRHRHGHECR